MTDAIKPIIGTLDDDVLQGGRGHEVFSGRAGDDLIYANNGHDLAYGGLGDDTIYGESGNDELWGSGGPSYVNLAAVTITEDYQGQVIFEGETAGYRNSLGSYKVDENGNIYDVQFHFANASLQGSGGDLIGGVSSSELELNAGDQIGFFIVANGYSYNNGYAGMDFDNGQLVFRNSDGSNASLNSTNPQLWYIGTDDQETQIVYHTYHTAAGVDGNDYSLNPDGILHTVGLLNTDAGEITLGFEDLYNGGDRDFDDSIFTVDIGQSNARVLDPNVSQGSGPDDVEYYYAYGTDGQLGRYDLDGNLIMITNQNDYIDGGNGNDVIHGRAGHDKLYGGSGNDDIYGGSGNDIIEGGYNNDTIEAGSGNDTVKGDSGHDVIHGQTGDDVIYGGTGSDHIYGGSDADSLYGESGNDHIDGGSGNDYLSGSLGNDHLYGQSGSDTLHGGGGNDRLEGGSDDDIIYGDDGQDNIDGGSGNDTIYGGNGNDSIDGRSGNDIIYAGDLNDVVRAGTGNDYIDAGSGNDKIYAGSNDDFIISGTGRDVVDGGSGIDTVSYLAIDSAINVDIHRKKVTGGDSDTLKSIENVIGTNYNDTFRGNRLDNDLNGAGGNDFIRGMTGQDTLTGGSGKDTFFWKQSDVDSNIDSILDFALDEDSLQFDLNSSLASLDIDQWLNFTTDGTNTSLTADFDADGDFSNATTFVELENISVNSLNDIQIAVA